MKHHFEIIWIRTGLETIPEVQALQTRYPTIPVRSFNAIADIAVPGATTESTGLPESGSEGGAFIMGAGTSTAHIMIPGS